jgi:hypothetical protein
VKPTSLSANTVSCPCVRLVSQPFWVSWRAASQGAPWCGDGLDGHLRSGLGQVLFIRPDVAAVNVRQRAVMLDGQPIEDENEGSLLYVMAKDEGQWRLVADQNTEVLDS